MAVLHPVVGPASYFLFLGIGQGGHCCPVRALAVGCDRLWRAVALQCLLHKSESSLLVSGLGDLAFEHFAHLVDDAQQIMHFAVDLHIHLVEMPFPMAEAFHPAYPLATSVTGEQGAEPVPPVPHGLVADVDPALRQKALDFA